jgi:hypothetical protein
MRMCNVLAQLLAWSEIIIESNSPDVLIEEEDLHAWQTLVTLEIFRSCSF